MEEEKQIGLTVKKEEDFSEWYNQIILNAELADYSPVRGFMVIRPRGFSIWEKIQDALNSQIKKHGVKNAYFPLLIPESFFTKEAQHAEGFAPELAWIETKEECEEKVAIRPTSETIMYDAYSKWIRSHRDLPLKINQWCNVLRWEVKQTKLFLRTREFLWQEGHCVYKNEEECMKEVLMYLEEYRKLIEDLLAIPVIVGEKTEAERFAGAKRTFTLEALMPDGKALQMGTSHNLGQNFSKTFDLKFMGEDKNEHYAWQNSWGVSTRLIGAVVMVHSDDNGLILPPKLAPNKAVIIPIIFKDTKDKVLTKAKEIQEKLKNLDPILDDREEHTPGWKYNEWELKGIPIRIEIGPKDIEKNQLVIVRRDTKEKIFVKEEELQDKINQIFEEMQKGLYDKANKFLQENILEVNDWKDFTKNVEQRKLVFCHFCGKKDCEEQIKEETTATSRCIPLNQKETKGKCIKCGKETTQRVYFSKAY